MKTPLLKHAKKVLLFFCAFFMSLAVSSSASALSGHSHISSAWNDYVWIYTENGAQRWDSNVFGQTLYNGLEAVNGITFNVSLDTLAQYGQYTNGSIVFTLDSPGNWAITGADLGNVMCEVWTASGSNQSQISSSMGVLTPYYRVNTSGAEHYAIDYKCSFETKTGQFPAYAYIRVGVNHNNDQSVIPIIAPYYLSGHIVSPTIRNVSFDYNTSNEGLENAYLSQIEENTSSLINGQKVIYDTINDNSDRIIASQNATTEAVENLSVEIQNAEDGEQSRWEQDHAERDEKESELEEQSEDLSLTAENPGNPFEQLFSSPDCQELPTVSSWFNANPMLKVCSPYPAQIRPVIEFVSSAILICLLLRLYFKLFKGGYAS